MQNRYTGDIADFGKFLLLKHLFPKENIATIWYLYPDETHNNDGSHTVEEGNTKVFPHCHALDSQMAEIFNTIHRGFIRHIDAFEILGVLPNGHFFRETILGQGAGYRKLWGDRALDFIQRNSCSVVCLDPDNGIEPLGMKRLSIIKQGKYTTLEEIERFFDLESVEHVMIYQHFNRLKKHDQQMTEAKERFQRLYEGRAAVTIIRHNPVQPRFYILLSKSGHTIDAKHCLEHLMYDSRAFFSLL